MSQKLIKGPIKGYKATDENMQCRGIQFKVGETFTLDNDDDLVICKNGFHFCEQPSGVWSYYSTGRVFEIEAYDVLISDFEPGTDYKRVCHEFKIISEIKVAGNKNTGYRNTGNGNTGDGNTGDGNTGNWNTGNRNTGEGNATDHSSGSLCINEQPVVLFDRKTNVDRKDINWSLVGDLSQLLAVDTEIDPARFLSIPNATALRIRKLHKRHIELRKE